MDRRWMVALVVAFGVIAAALLWPAGNSADDVESDRAAAARDTTKSRSGGADEQPPRRAPPRAHEPRSRRLDKAARQQLEARIERARTAATPKRPKAGASTDDAPHPTKLSLENKTGSSSEWEKRQLEILNELLGECFDLAASESPGLAGTIGVQFTIAGEPEVGGLVDNIAFMDDYSSIDQPTMRECMRESLYALELEPPPEGVRAARQVTLRLGTP